MSKRLTLFGLAALAALAVCSASASAAVEEAEFSSPEFPAKITATQVGEHTFESEAGDLKCKNATFTGVLNGEVKSISVSPSYANCTVNGAVATFAANGCTYTMLAGVLLKSGEKAESMGGMQIVCPAGKEMVVTVQGGCEMKIPAMAEPTALVYYRNKPFEGIEVEIHIGFEYSLNAHCGKAAAGKYVGIAKGISTAKGDKGTIGVL